MIQSEKRKDLAKVLVERMPKEVLAKLHILYDFNCQAREYLYNRFPDLFAFTKFLIDRWHAASHKYASVFKLQEYPVFQQLVSMGTEVLNKFLQHMHRQTSFMKQETKVTLIKAVVEIRNYLINEELTRLQKFMDININK